MAKWVNINGINYDAQALDGISEAAFMEGKKDHYKRIGNGKEERMKADYRELKKHFSKKEAKETKKAKEIRKAED